MNFLIFVVRVAAWSYVFEGARGIIRNIKEEMASKPDSNNEQPGEAA